MRESNLPRRALQGLLLLLALQGASHALAEETFSAAALRVAHSGGLDAAHQQWVCQYTRQPDGIVCMQCDELHSLLFDDLALADGAAQKSTKLIPLWGAPKSDDSSIGLAEMMLCDQSPTCSVRLTARWEDMESLMF